MDWIVGNAKNTGARRSRLVMMIVMLAASLFCRIDLLAQSGAGTIQGTVQDSTGAILPKVSIHVLNQHTGTAIDTNANSAGFYSIPSLFAGDYTLTFSAEGMEQYKTSILLQAAQSAVINPVLSPGSVSQQVTVVGNAIQLATYDSGTISSQLDFQRINQLPMNGRSLLTLAGSTTPGLENGGTRANGNMDAALEYVQDGAPLTNRNFGGAVNSSQAQLPDPDAVQEVKIVTANSSAQFATPATAILTTKSGTNHLHGSLFETARNNAIGIAKARQDPYNLKAPHLVRNEFGGSLGGPIIIPKFYNGKDKSFFFVAYERYSLRSNVSELVKTPTLAMRNGDFSGLVNGAGFALALYDGNTTDPVTYQRQRFQNNQIPVSRMSPLAKTLYAISPLPTSPDNPLVASNLTTAGINNATIPTTTFRLDQTFNQNNRAYLRYTDNIQTLEFLRNYPTQQAATIAGAGLPAGATNVQDLPVATFSAAIGFTHVFSPTFFSETVLGNQWFNQNFVGGGAPNFDFEAALGLPNNFGEVGFPQINGGVMNYGGTQNNYSVSQIITNLDENLTKTVGRHQLQFGGRYRHERFGALPDRAPDLVDFSSLATANIDPSTGANYSALPFTGEADADLFLGAAVDYSVALNTPYEHYRDMEFDTYFQDDFHVTSHLTINAGVRWEVHPAPYTKDGLLTSFDLKNKAIVLAKPLSFYLDKGYTTQAIITNLLNLGTKFETPQQAGIPDAMLFNYDFTFSPRIGFAYLPFGGKHGTVLRAGYGRYIYPIPVRNSLVEASGSPLLGGRYTQSYAAANQSPDGLPNYLLRAPQKIVAGQNSTAVVNTGSTTSILPGIRVTPLDPHYPPNFVTQVNATVEQPLRDASVVRVTYLFNHGSNLDQFNNFNFHPSNYVYETQTGQVPPTGVYAQTALGPYDQTLYAGNSVLDQRTGFSNDSALQVEYQRLYKSGYSYQAYYVFSRAERVGGNTFRDGQIYPAGDYAPGMLPSNDSKALNYFQNNRIDSAIPEHHISFNGIVDLPIGRGKKFFGNAGRFVDELIGGYQIAGLGNVFSEYFPVNSGNWGQTSPLEVYKNKYKVNDCRSGVCHSGYLWFNGYINPNQINSSSKGVSGIPANYIPYQVPLNNTPGNPLFGTNNIPVTLGNGKTVITPYAPGPGLNPFSKTYLHGPYNYSIDLSIFKVFPINEKVQLRVNMDAFNAFNIQGTNNPDGGTGIQTFLVSHNTPRQVQFTARLTF